MESSSRMDRCNRFIGEFNETACNRFSFREFSCFVRQSLGENEGVVRMFVVIENRGREEELMMPIVFFDPEDEHAWSVDRLVEFLDLSESKAERRLTKACL